jgi:hypothetical protein
MNGFDRLERELELAAKRQRSASRWRRARGAGGAVAIALALGSVAVIAVGAIVLLHGRRAMTPTRAGSPASQAQGAAWARALACDAPNVPLKQFGFPAASAAAPDSRLVAALGVLRSPWSTADAAPRAGCAHTGPALLSFVGRVNVRYVRYVGPGPRGGSMFLVPSSAIQAPRLALAGTPALRKIAVLARPTHSPLACVVTLGGGSPSPPGCSSLETIRRPLSVVFAPPVRPLYIPLRIARRLCSHASRPMLVKLHIRSRVVAACVAGLTRPLAVRLPPEAIAGVVRDGIATVDVYAGSGSRRRLVLADVPVRDNVYAFATGGRVTGELELVFKDTAGRSVPTTAIQVGKLGPFPMLGRAALPAPGPGAIGKGMFPLFPARAAARKSAAGP